MPAGSLVRRGALVAVLLGAAACAPAAHQITSAHPASSQAPVGPRVVLPASEEAAAAASDAPPDASDAHDHHDHHDHSAPARNEAPAAPSPQKQPPSPQPHQHTP